MNLHIDGNKAIRIIFYSFMAISLLAVTALSYLYFVPLKSLPSPIYGGDYYYQLGHVYHFLRDGAFMESSSLYDALPTYMPVYPWIISLITKITGLDALHGMFYTSIIFKLLSILLWVVFFRLLFKGKLPMIALGVAMILFSNIIILKYTTFALAIMLPIFLSSLWIFYNARSTKNSILFGVVYGLSSLTYTIFFVGITLMIVMLFIYDLYRYSLEKNRNTTLKSISKEYLTVFLVSLPLILIYWYEPIFVHHLHMYYNRSKLDFPDFSKSSVAIGFLFETLKKIFFNSKGIYEIFISLLNILGVIMLFFYKDDKLRNFILFYFISSLAITFSYFITEPLFDSNFIPYRMNLFFINSSILLLELYGIYAIFNLLKLSMRTTWFTVFILGMVFLIHGYMSFSGQTKSKWYQRGLQPTNPIFTSVGEYIREHSTVEDVILTTKELGFAINSVSGNKLVTGRWAQNGSPYTDLSQRDVDTSRILYGKNDEIRRDLLKKYNVKYVFWSNYWVPSEFTFNRKGKVVGIYDPLIAFDKPIYRHQLEREKIYFLKTRFWLDPSARKKTIRQYDILITSPQNYRRASKPWTRDLDGLLKKVWNYRVGDHEAAALYKVEI